jgi:CAAX protease family protein
VDGTATYLQVLADKGVISGDAASLSIQYGLLMACGTWALALAVATGGRLSYPRYRTEAEQLDLHPSTPPPGSQTEPTQSGASIAQLESW